VQPGPDGRLEAKRVYDFISHCQRVSEGQLLEIHAQTWKYNQLLADQRIIIDKRRANLLDTEQAWQELAQRAPQRAAELDDVPADARVEIGRASCREGARMGGVAGVEESKSRRR